MTIVPPAGKSKAHPRFVNFWLLAKALVITGCWFWAGCLTSCRPFGEETRQGADSDSLRYEYHSMHRSLAGCHPDSETCTHVRHVYPRFKGVNSPLSDSLAVHFQEFGFPMDSIQEKKLDSTQKAFLSEYRNMQKDFPGYDLTWNDENEARVQSQNNRWVCLEFSTYGFTGGAHRYANLNYRLLDKNKGRRLYLRDFFDSTGLTKLTRLGETEFCKVRGIAPEQSLEDAGFSFEDGRFYLPENFRFTAEGLVFVFNAYEVGPYVLGDTEFLLPANKIVGWMKKNNP